MKFQSVARFVVGLFMSGLVLLTTARAQVMYNVVPLPARVGAASISDQGINNQGSVIGTSRVNPEEQGFLWKNKKIINLPTLGGTCSHAAGLSQSDHVVGRACLSGDAVTHATLWKQGQVIDIDTFGGTSSTALRINHFDDAAGYFFALDGTIHAFFWSNGTWSDLGNLGGSFTDAFAIDDQALVGGQSDISNTPDPRFGVPPSHAFVWQAGVLTDLGSIFGADFSYVNAIDAQGRIVGTSDLAGDTAAHAFVWNHGVVTDLMTLPFDNVSWAGGMNNLGQVVGLAGIADKVDGPPDELVDCPCQAVLWQNNQILDLNTMVPPQWSLIGATDINDKGEILANAIAPTIGPVLLVPIAAGDVSTSTRATPVPRQYSKMSQVGPRSYRRDRFGRVTEIW